ncbi:hypothetical protein NGRA_3458 [Nosema granulosis]|uniref:Uncharacterized protein n=1 Tax=Nosema granulosis TaxID=83296 RepID=A0A9P6GUQ8_9MICR|nr:hypothetical protein NGRA_3458 [Nosema granulosis]
MNNQEVQNTNNGNIIEDDPCKHIISYREDQNTSKSKILLDDSNFTEADIDDVFIEPNSSDDYNQNINNHIPTERMFKFKDSLLFWQTLEKTSKDSKNKSFNNRS